MAFRKDLWNRIGGFTETVFFGEDTLFDLEARRLTPPAFVNGAKAIYRPQYNFVTAFNQLASYSVSDGILGVRRARLVRNAARCVAQVMALLCLFLLRVPAVRSSQDWWWAVIPFLAVLRSSSGTPSPPPLHIPLPQGAARTHFPLLLLHPCPMDRGHLPHSRHANQT